MKITSTIFVFLTVILATVLAHCQVPDVPQEVRIAAGMALAASNTDGIHEEAFKWGKDKYGNVLVSMSTPGKPCFTEVQKVCLSYFGAANPEIDARLVTVDGFAHVHPRGNSHESYPAAVQRRPVLRGGCTRYNQSRDRSGQSSRVLLRW